MTRGVPKKSRTDGQADGLLIGRLRERERAGRLARLDAHVGERFRSATQGSGCAGISQGISNPPGKTDNRCHPHPVCHRPVRPTRRRAAVAPGPSRTASAGGPAPEAARPTTPRQVAWAASWSPRRWHLSSTVCPIGRCEGMRRTRRSIPAALRWTSKGRPRSGAARSGNLGP